MAKILQPRFLFATTTQMFRYQGDAVHVAEVSRELTALNAPVTLVAAGEPTQKLGEVYYINGGRVKPGSFIRRVASYIKHTANILFHVIKHAKKADILYTRDALLGFSFYALRPITQLPLIFEMNGLRGAEKQMQVNGAFTRLSFVFFSFFEKFITTHADHVICVTQGLKDILIDDYSVDANKISVISNGVNLKLFTPAVDLDKQLQIYTNLNVSIDDKIIMYIGGLQPWQDITTVIKSVNRLAHTIDRLTFVIVGDGIQYDSLKKTISKLESDVNIIMTGKISYANVPSYLSIADVCVLPRTKDVNEKTGLSPIKLYSYLACGKPIIATRIKGFEFLEEHHIGSLIPIDDDICFADAIAYWLQRIKEDKQLPNRIRTYAEENCGWDKTAKEVLAVCKGVIEKK